MHPRVSVSVYMARGMSRCCSKGRDSLRSKGKEIAAPCAGNGEKGDGFKLKCPVDMPEARLRYASSVAIEVCMLGSAAAMVSVRASHASSPQPGA